MSKPIVCLFEQLRQFAEYFRPCFSRCQRWYFVIVFLSLAECEERKTLMGLLRVLGELVSLAGLSRFLNQWRWSTTALAHRWGSYCCERMSGPVLAEQARLKATQPHRVGRPKETVVTGFLIFDDSAHTRPKGRAMEGLGRHYSTTEKKVVSGHCLFSGLYVLLDQRCPLEPRMYCQKRVCEAEGRPSRASMRISSRRPGCASWEEPLKSVRCWGFTMLKWRPTSSTEKLPQIALFVSQQDVVRQPTTRIFSRAGCRRAFPGPFSPVLFFRMLPSKDPYDVGCPFPQCHPFASEWMTLIHSASKSLRQLN